MAARSGPLFRQGHSRLPAGLNSIAQPSMEEVHVRTSSIAHSGLPAGARWTVELRSLVCHLQRRRDRRCRLDRAHANHLTGPAAASNPVLLERMS